MSDDSDIFLVDLSEALFKLFLDLFWVAGGFLHDRDQTMLVSQKVGMDPHLLDFLDWDFLLHDFV